MNIDDVIDKIKKAVRLANKTTSDGERETALRLARRLAERNGVAFEEVAGEAGDGDSGKAVYERDDTEETRPNGAEMGFIAYILKRHFGVILVVNYRRSNRRRITTSWVGSRLNIDIARHVYHILVRESARAWRECLRKNRAGADGVGSTALVVYGKEEAGKKPDRTAFMRGFFWAISQKLEAHPLRNDLEESVRLAERKLIEYQQENGAFAQSRSSSSGKGETDVRSLASGFAAGNGINLSRPCEDKGGYSPLAIGNGSANCLRLAM